MSACYFKSYAASWVIWLNSNLYNQDDNNITNNNKENRTAFGDSMINFVWAKVEHDMAETLRRYTLKGICKSGGLDGEHNRWDR